MAIVELAPGLERLVRDARTATLATIRPDGRPRLVPVCFVVEPGPIRPGTLIYTPLDEKPKREADPRVLARVRDILARPAVEILVDRWDEDWARLAWVRLDGTASIVAPVRDAAPRTETIVAPGRDAAERTETIAASDRDAAERTEAIAALRRKYPQYRAHDLEGRPLLRIEVERTTAWSAAGEDVRPGGA